MLDEIPPSPLSIHSLFPADTMLQSPCRGRESHAAALPRFNEEQVPLTRPMELYVWAGFCYRRNCSVIVTNQQAYLQALE